MSAALDTMSKEDLALMQQMADDDAAFVPDDAPGTNAPAPSEPQHEPEVAAAKTADADPAEPKTVDKRALDEERSRRKKAEATAAELQRKYDADLARANTRFEMLAAAAESHVKQAPAVAAAPVAEATAPPAFETDPQGYIQHEFKRLNEENQRLAREVQEVRTGTTNLTQAQQQAQALADLHSWGARQEQEAMAEHSDYQAAMNHLMASRTAQMRAIGIQDPAQISNAIAQDVRGIAQHARQSGDQFGKMLYKLALANGYQASGAAPAGDATALTPSRSATPVVDASSAAERLLRGADMATTIGATGGAPRGETAPTAIAQMSDTEFNKLLAETQARGPAAMRSLFGE